MSNLYGDPLPFPPELVAMYRERQLMEDMILRSMMLPKSVFVDLHRLKTYDTEAALLADQTFHECFNGCPGLLSRRDAIRYLGISERIDEPADCPIDPVCVILVIVSFVAMIGVLFGLW